MALGRIATNSAARRSNCKTVTGTSQVRVLSELYEARLHEAQSVAEYLALWMYGRDVHPRGRIAGTGFDTKGRFQAAFRQHLLLARRVARNVMAACPEFTLLDEKRIRSLRSQMYQSFAKLSSPIVVQLLETRGTLCM